MIAIELPNHTMQQHATREPKASRVLLLLCVMPVRHAVICELARRVLLTVLSWAVYTFPNKRPILRERRDVGAAAADPTESARMSARRLLITFYRTLPASSRACLMCLTLVLCAVV